MGMSYTHLSRKTETVTYGSKLVHLSYFNTSMVVTYKILQSAEYLLKC